MKNAENFACEILYRPKRTKYSEEIACFRAALGQTTADHQ